MARSTFRLQGPRISPDGRFALYVSNPSGRLEAFVRPFNAAPNPPAAPPGGQWQVSDQGSVGHGVLEPERQGAVLPGPESGGDGRFSDDLSASRVRQTADAVQPDGSDADRSVGGRHEPRWRAGRDGCAAAATPAADAARPPGEERRHRRTARDCTERPSLSPDGTRVAITKNNPQNGNADIWTFDLATGQGTADHQRHAAGLRAGLVSRQQTGGLRVDPRQPTPASTESRPTERARKSCCTAIRLAPGIALTDWSADGKFFTFFTLALLVVPLEPPVADPLNRKEIEWLKEEYDIVLGRFSPDSRFLAYMSNETKFDVMQVYVRPFDASKPEKPGPGPAVQVSTNNNGAAGMLSWRQDGKELYFMTRDFEVMAVDITTTPAFQAGAPRLLFKLPRPVPGAAQGKSVSPDGQRFIVADAGRGGNSLSLTLGAMGRRAKATPRPIALRGQRDPATGRRCGALVSLTFASCNLISGSLAENLLGCRCRTESNREALALMDSPCNRRPCPPQPTVGLQRP